MAFSKRRGRPKRLSTIGRDKGTSELQKKRQLGLTEEPLDLCLKRSLITENQHNAGIRLRWLYTLKFGAPTISAYLPDNTGGHSCRYTDINWIKRKQSEYNILIKKLDEVRARKIVLDICVLGTIPNFLVVQGIAGNTSKELQLFLKGMEAIA